jgi:DcmR-like sensory protein
MELDHPAAVQPAGAHIAYLYHDDEERRRVVGDYVRSGLSAGELVAYLADVSDRGLTEALEKLGILPVDDAHQHQLVAETATTAYEPEHGFVPDQIIARLRDLHERGHSFKGTRVVDQMSWALRGIPGSEQFLTLEALINDFLVLHPMTILCEYDMRCFDGATGFAVLGLHPALLVRGRVIPNPYLPAPSESVVRR